MIKSTYDKITDNLNKYIMHTILLGEDRAEQTKENNLATKRAKEKQYREWLGTRPRKTCKTRTIPI